jgi:2,4-dichlorophenol 6-monooxygenase
MSTRPGHPLPHAWVERGQGGDRTSTVNLVTPGRFLLIAGEEGHGWCEAALRMSEELGVPLDAVRIGHASGDLLDPRMSWTRLREHGSRGAILVRPDRFVAWRSHDEVNNPHGLLTGVLRQVLHRA